MKKIFVVLGVAFALLVIQHFANPRSSQVSAQTAMDDHDGALYIPLPHGHFSVNSQGSLAVCRNPGTFAEESCSTPGALVVPLTELYNGVTAVDKEGTSCVSFALVATNFPPNALPSNVIANAHCVGKTLDYDPTIGAGDGTYTVFSGGTCNGSVFDSTGATEILSGGFHFAVSEGGNRSDFVITSLTDPLGGIGGASFSGTYLRQ
ncbi:MAG: hypothetical protein WB780_15625 [Candidatus Acidiferrales bacterium]